MQWRCEWCGKPQESDDPPCDNCGHGKFEKAIVRQPAESDGPRSTTVWVCTACGREHTKHSPPCSRCGNATLEREEKVITEGDLTDGPGTSAVESSIESETTTVWVCADCGREHTRNSPPCTRCGSPALQRETKAISDSELAAPSYLELLTPQYAIVLGLVLLLAATAVLGFAGVVDLPFFPDDGVPEVEDVPGNESATGSFSHAAIEEAYLASVNERHADAGISQLERSDYLDEVATFYNQRRVKWLLADGSLPSEEQLAELLSQSCSANPTVQNTQLSTDGATDTGELGDRLATAVTGEANGTLDTGGTTTGVDVHSVGDELFLVGFVCEK